MVGFDVTPRTPWSIRPLRSPCSTNSRDRKSIHTLWPCSASCSSGVVAMPDLLTQWDVQHSLPCPDGQREKRVPDRLALRLCELPQPVRDGLLIAARFPPQGGPGLAGADGVRGREATGPRGHAGGGAERGCGFWPAVQLSFGDQGHRAEPYMRIPDSSTQMSASRLCHLPNWINPCSARIADIPGSRCQSARDERVRHRDAEAGLGIGQALVLAVVAVALGVREDDDAVGREGGQGVLDRERRLGLARVTGGVDPLLLESLDGLLLSGVGLADRLVRIGDPEGDLGLVRGGGDDQHLRALDLLAEHVAQQRRVNRLRGQDQQLHREAATPGSSGTNGTSSPGETRMTTTATSSRTDPPPISSTCSSMLRAITGAVYPRQPATKRVSASGPKRSSSGLASITPSV